MSADMAVDGALAVLIAWTAWQSVTSREAFRAVVLFVAFGLLVSLAWLRLGAPDVALAEAAVGAGLTGVLFLETLGHLRRREDAKETRPRRRVASTAALAVGLAGGLLAAVVLRLEPAPGRVPAPVTERLPATGVSNPVTGVLLDFRSADTLVEVAVVLAAVLALRGLAPQPGAGPPPPPRQPMLAWFAARLAPVALLVGAYLWWSGSHAPGGAFQAAAVFGAVYALLRVSGLAPRPPGWRRPLRSALAAGVAAFAGLGLAMSATGRPFLDLPDGLAHGLIVSLEAVLAASLGVCLVALVAGEPEGRR